MRISTSWMQQQAVNAILDRQSELAVTQQQIASGRRIVTPSDDPSGSARALDLTHFDAATAQFQRNIDSATSRLNLEEQTLGSFGDALRNIRTLALQGITATQNNQTRQDIAVELRQRLEQLVQVANSRDANGEYLFAGTVTNTQPFVQGASGVSYVGNQSQRNIAVAPSETISIGDPGSDVFQLIPTGNGTFSLSAANTNQGTVIAGASQVTDYSAWDRGTYRVQFTSPSTYQVLDSANAVVTSGAYNGNDNNTIAFRGVQINFSGQATTGDSYTVAPSATRDVFASVTDLVNALQTSVATPHDRAVLSEQVNRAVDNIDQALTRNLDVRARVGARLNTIDLQKTANDSLGLQIKTTLSGIEDLDYASAISRLNLQQASLQAAQQAFVRVQGLSLFNYLQS